MGYTHLGLFAIRQVKQADQLGPDRELHQVAPAGLASSLTTHGCKRSADIWVHGQ